MCTVGFDQEAPSPSHPLILVSPGKAFEEENRYHSIASCWVQLLGGLPVNAVPWLPWYICPSFKSWITEELPEGTRNRENDFFVSSWTIIGTGWGPAPVPGLRADCLLHLPSEIPTVIPKKDQRMCVPGSSDPRCLSPLRSQGAAVVWSLDGTTVTKDLNPGNFSLKARRLGLGQLWLLLAPVHGDRAMVDHVLFVTPYNLYPPAPPLGSPYSAGAAGYFPWLLASGCWAAENACSFWLLGLFDILGSFIVLWVENDPPCGSGYGKHGLLKSWKTEVDLPPILGIWPGSTHFAFCSFF